MALRALSAVTALAVWSARAEPEEKESEFTEYYVKEQDGYEPNFDNGLEKFAKKLDASNPMECFGEQMEVFDRLTSPEW